MKKDKDMTPLKEATMTPHPSKRTPRHPFSLPRTSPMPRRPHRSAGRLPLGARGLLIKACMLGALLFTLAAPQAQAQDYDWTNDVPEKLRGTWVLLGQKCDDHDSQLAIFSDGGYRWRKSYTEWGFARGKYAMFSPASSRIYFRLQRFVQQEQPDFSISLSGNELKKYSYGSGRMREYEKCPR